MSTDWQLKVVDGDGQQLRGAAVLVSPNHAITCAHVVYNAVLARGGSDPGPGSSVYVRRPGLTEPVLTGTVVEDGWWWKDHAPWDLAVLRLEPAPGVAPAALTPVGSFRRRGEWLSIVGFPGVEHGQWVTARLRRFGGSRSEYCQFDVAPDNALHLQRGFSGAGVIEDHSGEVLGIVCEASADGRIGWMIPTEEIQEAWEPLAEVPGPVPEPLPDPAAQADQIRELALAVAELDTVALPETRQLFHQALEVRLRRRIRLDQSAHVYAEHLVSIAHRNFGVLRRVLEQLDQREEGTAAMREVWATARPLLGEDA
ncbi:S1 family peptidase [Nocardiopsis ganjiahuensis]|uniref:S1 family peptidase n=1 Tax=Nocardiopsis ganjiahuensis TaxID=239984 RepID=UPI00034C6A49|nr:serine protease [Nocardiopsis ganjiahuensis]